jgi:hypothetical protein
MVYSRHWFKSDGRVTETSKPCRTFGARMCSYSSTPASRGCPTIGRPRRSGPKGRQCVGPAVRPGLRAISQLSAEGAALNDSDSMRCAGPSGLISSRLQPRAYARGYALPALRAWVPGQNVNRGTASYARGYPGGGALRLTICRVCRPKLTHDFPAPKTRRVDGPGPERRPLLHL